MPRNRTNKPQPQKQASPDAIWIRKKLRANEPFVLDELTPSGVKLFVALGWPNDEKGNGYRDAKKKVADRVPSQDWSFIEEGSETYPQKSEGKWGGHLKQVVAISANGMKHLLAHVPNQELATAWVQYLANAEEKLALVRDANVRGGLASDNKNARDSLFSAGLGANGASISQAVAFSTFRGETIRTVQDRIRQEKDLKPSARVTVHDHASAKTNAQQRLLMAELALGAEYAGPGTLPQTIGQQAAFRAAKSVAKVSGGRDVRAKRGKNGRVRDVVPFEMKEGPALRPSRASRLIEKDLVDQKEEKNVLPGAGDAA